MPHSENSRDNRKLVSFDIPTQDNIHQNQYIQLRE